MPRIFDTTVLRQEEQENKSDEEKEDDEEEEVDLYKDCLTPEEASYGFFSEPGGVFGMGIAIAKNAGLDDIDDEEKEKEFLEPVGETSQAFWGDSPSDDTITTKEVLGRFIDAYGCGSVKRYINENIEDKKEEAEKEKWAKKWGVDE